MSRLPIMLEATAKSKIAFRNNDYHSEITEGESLDRTLKLFELIAILKAVHPRKIVWFDFCRAYPSNVESSRGDYSHLALTWDADLYYATKRPEPQSAGALITKLEEVIGKELEGYKGGMFRMELYTPIWVDNHGDWTATGIVGFEADYDPKNDTEGYIILLTKRTESYI